jgi:cytochrome P450
MSADVTDKQYSGWPPDHDTIRCPVRYFASIRQRSPVYKFPTLDPNGEATYLVTGWAECCAVLMHPKQFINAVRPIENEQELEPLPLPEVPRLYQDRNIFFTDGEDHSVKRSWALRFSTPERLRAYRPLIQEEVDRLIDTFARDGHCDFMKQFTDRMSMRVIRKLMGLPESADSMIRRLSAAIPPVDNNPDATRKQLQEMADSSRDMLVLCAQQVLNRYEYPTGDFISEIVKIQVDRDGKLDPNTLAKHIMVTIFGADHAMGAHLAQVMARVGQDPNLQERLRGNRALIWPLTLETLRSENPVPWLFRRCTEDTRVGDVLIPAGAVVLVATIAGNFDPKEFPDPEKFDIDRPNIERNHLSMGRGAHRCVGSLMARLQTEITVNRMLDKLLDIRLDMERSNLVPVPSLGFRVPTAVHLTFRAAG